MLCFISESDLRICSWVWHQWTKLFIIFQNVETHHPQNLPDYLSSYYLTALCVECDVKTCPLPSYALHWLRIIDLNASNTTSLTHQQLIDWLIELRFALLKNYELLSTRAPDQVRTVSLFALWTGSVEQAPTWHLRFIFSGRFKRNQKNRKHVLKKLFSF